jgi:hypothetical protein
MARRGDDDVWELPTEHADDTEKRQKSKDLGVVRKGSHGGAGAKISAGKAGGCRKCRKDGAGMKRGAKTNALRNVLFRASVCDMCSAGNRFDIFVRLSAKFRFRPGEDLIGMVP